MINFFMNSIHVKNYIFNILNRYRSQNKMNIESNYIPTMVSEIVVYYLSTCNKWLNKYTGPCHHTPQEIRNALVVQYNAIHRTAINMTGILDCFYLLIVLDTPDQYGDYNTLNRVVIAQSLSEATKIISVATNDTPMQTQPLNVAVTTNDIN